MRNLLLLVLTLLSSGLTIAQDAELPKIESFDLSDLWVSNGTTDIDFPEYFTNTRTDYKGFIGDDFQRLYITVDEVIKNSNDPLTYFVNGTSVVKGNACSFLGTLKIDSTQMQERYPLSVYKGAESLVDLENVTHIGTVFCTYELFENKNQKWTGYFKGQLSTQYYLSTDGRIKYNAMSGFSDSYKNNSFVGTWTSYSSGKSKTANWGEFRVPDSGDLDIGAGGFSPNPKYHDKGWKN